MVYYTDRMDITEELTRLDSHFGQLEQCLRPTQPVGRKLDFLAQEMFREINTIGSKANDSTISGEVVTLKTELEKIRSRFKTSNEQWRFQHAAFGGNLRAVRCRQNDALRQCSRRAAKRHPRSDLHHPQAEGGGAGWRRLLLPWRGGVFGACWGKGSSWSMPSCTAIITECSSQNCAPSSPGGATCY
ncbi:MAG: hypothetical protein CM1200mP34_1870 [Verrucomicrobiales bacterium]|nr:MAG: hypothetical protein CM1200mP34_1870 [Verrucomicrobiales bacterium]